MISSSVKFLLNDKILEIKNPDPNQTILNYIRTELKKLELKRDAQKVVVAHALLFWVS